MKRQKLNQKGFTFIEVITVVAIMGILALASYPGILNALKVRNLENGARAIMTTLQQAKFQAARTKLNCRVRFDNSSGKWFYSVEREIQSGTWEELPGTKLKSVSSRYVVSVNLPSPLDGAAGKVAVFSPFGRVADDYYSSTLNSLSIQDTTITAQAQPGTRNIYIYAGGSIRYEKAN